MFKFWSVREGIRNPFPANAGRGHYVRSSVYAICAGGSATLQSGTVMWSAAASQVADQNLEII